MLDAKGHHASFKVLKVMIGSGETKDNRERQNLDLRQLMMRLLAFYINKPHLPISLHMMLGRGV